MIAVGRIKSGPERELISDYMTRLERQAPHLGFRDVREIEVEAGGSSETECARITERIETGGQLILFDETGKTLSSGQFAALLAKWRDEGQPSASFCIGGADGFPKDFKQRATMKIAFGPQTWPHRLARVMAAEQLYRAATILAGTPYHREG